MRYFLGSKFKYIARCDLNSIDAEKRTRRKNFYIKNGYKDSGYWVNSTSEYQEILINNGTFGKEEFSQFIKKYSNGAMKIQIIKKENNTECENIL